MSTDTDALVAFLRTAILAHKAVAQAATQGEWVDDGGVYVGHPMNEILDHVYQDGDRAHILANQPNAVIRKCEADLRIIKHCETFTDTQDGDNPFAWLAARLAERVLGDLAQAYGLAGGAEAVGESA